MTRRLIYADALTDDILKSAVMIDDRGIQTGYEIAIELIKRQPTVDAEPHWIPCSERLPEKDGYYLTTTCYRQVYCDYWNEDHFDRTEAVIAWMPLPEPYEVKE